MMQRVPTDAPAGYPVVVRRAEFLHQLVSYLLREWPMAKRVIDQEIEKNKRLTDLIQGTVERQYKKSA